MASSSPGPSVRQPENVAEEEEDEQVDAVEHSIGVFGWWHVFVFVTVTAIKPPTAWHQLSFLFIAANVSFTCENDTRLNQCPEDCEKYVYNRSVFTETIATEWDLVCDRAFLQPVTQAVAMFGIMVGNLLFAYVADRFGRKIPLTAAALLQAIAGALVAASPYFIMFMIFRFIAGVATGGAMIISFVFIMEVVGIKWRTKVGIVYQMPFSLGHLTLPLISYTFRNWRYLQIAISVYSFFLIIYFWVLPRSPRWLLSVRRKEQAIQVLEEAARFNKRPTENIEKYVTKHMERYGQLKKNSHGNFSDLVRTPIMRLYTIAMGLNWLVCGFCFYGGAQYVNNLSENIFINVAYSALIQLPGAAFAMWSADFWGRKATLIFANLLAAISIFMTAFVPRNPKWIRVVFACFELFGLVVAFPTVYIYSGELFPTAIRNVGVGVSSMCARWGSMVAPFILQVGIQWIPPFLFTILPLIAASMCMKLPETKGCKLPENIEEAEDFVRNPMKTRRKKKRKN